MRPFIQQMLANILNSSRNLFLFKQQPKNVNFVTIFINYKNINYLCIRSLTALKLRIPVYFIPGLAASPAIFENIKLNETEFEMFFLEWKIPHKGETLQ